MAASGRHSNLQIGINLILFKIVEIIQVKKTKNVSSVTLRHYYSLIPKIVLNCWSHKFRNSQAISKKQGISNPNIPESPFPICIYNSTISVNTLLLAASGRHSNYKLASIWYCSKSIEIIQIKKTKNVCSVTFHKQIPRRKECQTQMFLKFPFKIFLKLNFPETKCSWNQIF